LSEVFTDSAEIAGAEKRRYISGPIGMKMDAEAGEANVFRQRSDIYPALPEIEHCRVVDNLPRPLIHYFVHTHRLLEHRTGMEKLHAEVESISGPLCAVGAKADRLILVVVEVIQCF
jgi:hypothetical protein